MAYLSRYGGGSLDADAPWDVEVGGATVMESDAVADSASSEFVGMAIPKTEDQGIAGKPLVGLDSDGAGGMDIGRGLWSWLFSVYCFGLVTIDGWGYMVRIQGTTQSVTLYAVGTIGRSTVLL